MSKREYSVGLAEIQFGKASRVGFMPAVMEKLGIVYQDTCKVTQDEPETTEHFEEGASVPFLSFVKRKPPKVTFSIVVDSLELMQRLLGGVLVGDSWVDGARLAGNMAIRIISQQGLMINIPNSAIKGKINWDVSSKGVFQVDVEATPQTVDTGKHFSVEWLEGNLKLDKPILEFAKELSSTGLTVTASDEKPVTSITAVAVGTASTWITPVSVSGAVATIKVTANTGEERSGKVMITANGKAAYVTVAQAGAK